MKKIAKNALLILIFFLINLGAAWVKETKNEKAGKNTSIGVLMPFDNKEKLKIMNEKEVKEALKKGDFVEVK